MLSLYGWYFRAQMKLSVMFNLLSTT